MKRRTKGEQKAFLEGFEACADNIENYLSDKGKELLKCLLIAVRNAVEIEDKNENKDEMIFNALDKNISPSMRTIEEGFVLKRHGDQNDLS